MPNLPTPTELITGAPRGLGLALARAELAALSKVTARIQRSAPSTRVVTAQVNRMEFGPLGLRPSVPPAQGPGHAYGDAHRGHIPDDSIANRARPTRAAAGYAYTRRETDD